MKKIVLFLLMAAILMTGLLSACSTAGQDASQQSSDSETVADQGGMSEQDEAIFDAFYTNFRKLAEVPRPSHHEEKISRFLYDWASEKGYDVHQDDALNIIFDVPATSGKEDAPLVALQAHMDMVAVARDGIDFDPLNDPIKPVRDDAAGTLTADGTSLGADDGVGDATIMTFLESGEEHGPLRVIITTNEEDGMTGTFNLDPEWLQAPEYLINLDAVDSDSAIVSTASGTLVKGSKDVLTVDPTGDTALKITIGGLKGGHSGVDIDKNRCNAIIAVGAFLQDLSDQGIAYDLASFEGGSAPNAIPSNATCVVVVKADIRDAMTQAADSYLGKLQEAYKDIEDGITFTVEDTDMLDSVIAREDADAAVALVTNMINGVYTMSADKADLVESSSNLGLFSLTADGNTFTTYERSSVGARETEIVDEQTSLAEKNGFTVKKEKSADPWAYDPNNQLARIASDVYQEINGAEFELVAIHAGLECGTYAVDNPDLSMISIGADITDEHTPNETLQIASVPKMYKLLKGILAKLAA